MAAKRWIVAALVRACEWTHPVTHRRPWLWLPFANVWCPLAHVSSVLDERWGTSVWSPVRSDVSIGSGEVRS